MDFQKILAQIPLDKSHSFIPKEQYPMILIVEPSLYPKNIFLKYNSTQ